jgi:hypothetical protein
MDELDKIVITDEVKVLLREEQTRLLKIIDALSKLDKSKEWDTFKETVFAKSLTAIERQMLNECVAKDVDINKIYRLQGEWAWAKQFTETDRFVENLKKQLEEIKKKLT